MEQHEDVFDRAYRFLVERTLAHYGLEPVGLKIIHVGGERPTENTEKDDTA